MSRNFSLDTTAAKEANSGGKRITEPGPYTGKFRTAFYEKNRNGTESVNLIFVSDGGQEVGPLALYTHNKDGEPLPSYKTLNAILACMRLRGIEGAPGKVSLYDFDSRGEVTKDKTCYPALVGPRVGLVLQGEEYENNQGEIKTRMIVAAPFEADSRKMAEEVLSKVEQATALERYLTWFADHKVKPLKTIRSAPAQASQPASVVDDFDDAIPF